MKPENVFVTKREGGDFVKIVDFGIAKMSDVETPGAPGRKLTKTGMIFGTPEYMSPEQAAGKPLDHRVDIYAIGVIFFEMLTGRVPFVGDTFIGILTQHMFEEPPRMREVNSALEAPEPVEAFVARALAKDPAARFQTCTEMLEELELLRRGEELKGGTFVGFGEPVKYKPKHARHVAPENAVTAEFPSARPPAPSPGSSRGAVIGVLVGVAVVGAGAAALYATQAGGASSVEGPGTVIAAPPIDAGAPAVLAAAEIDAGAERPTPVDAGPRMVAVHVATSQDGARVWVVDRGDVCTETPCSFESEAGVAITLRARRGRAEGELAITPEADTHVTIALVARRPTKSGGDPGGSDPGGGHGDLKIPDVFRHPR